MPDTLTVGSLFSGIEGFGLGFEQAGMSVSWRCEIDEKCRELLSARWPGVPVYDDVRTVHGHAACGGHNLRLASVFPEGHVVPGRESAVDSASSRSGGGAPDHQGVGVVSGTAIGDNGGDRTCDRCLPAVDVLCGGFPCQDLSVAGRRAGLAGDRSGLFHDFMRIASEITPRWVVIENVPGLLSSNGGRDMGVVLGTLADIGYGWCYRVLDAQYFGVAQRRRRVFIVGCLGDPASAAQVLLEPESCDGDSPPSRDARKSAAVGTLAGTSPGGGWRFGADEAAAGQLVPEVARSLNSHHNRCSEDVDTFVPEIAAPLSTANGVNSNSGGRRQEDDVNVVAETLRSHPRPGSNSNGAIVTVCRDSDPIAAENLAHPVTCRNGDPGVVAYPIAIRDRDHGAVAEVGEEGIYNALRAGDGGSSRQPLLMHSIQPDIVATVSAWQMRNSQGSNQFGVKVGEEVTDTLDTAGAPGVAYTTPLRASGAATAHGAGIGREGDPGLTLDTDGSAAVAVYRKATKAGHGFERWEADETAATIDAGGHGPRTAQAVLGHDMAVRRLTPMECERLQGFPDEWTGGFVDSTRYRMLGNAVCVSVARWIGERLLAVTHGY